jgi:hypothetical protein
LNEASISTVNKNKDSERNRFKRRKIMKITLLTLIVVLGLLAPVVMVTPEPAVAGDWSISIGTGPWYYPQPRPIYQNPYPYYPRQQYYYPYYNPNPVVRRDVYGGGYAAPDGTFHSDNVVEDRHSSYYSPGRNQAVTPPRTTYSQTYGPGYSMDQERTSWIGADGRPHSTTIDRTTTADPYGNTHTDTQVTLKNKKVGGAAGGTTVPVPGTVTPVVPQNPNEPILEKMPVR